MLRSHRRFFGPIARLALALPILLTARARAGDGLPWLDLPAFPITDEDDYVTALAVADVDGDGHLDAVFPHSDPDEVVVLLGLGDGRFGAPLAPTPVGGGPIDIDAADLDIDGDIDLVVASYDKGIAVLLGSGDGSFVPAAPVDGSFVTYFAATAQLDADGVPDLVVPHVGGVATFLGAGDGTFNAAYATTAGKLALGYSLADATGDGLRDVTVSDGGSITVLPGAGDGTLGAPIVLPLSPVGSADGVVVADLLGDALPDLAVMVAIAGVIEIRPGLGDGAFGPTTLLPVDGVYGGSLFGPVLVGDDLDGDGSTDLLASAGGHDPAITDPLVHVLRSDGAGGFTTSTQRFPTGPAIATADADEDGDPDLLTPRGRFLEVALNRGDGRWRSTDLLKLPGISGQALAADLDDDGQVDLAGIHYLGPVTTGATVFSGLGGGAFGPSTLFPTKTGDFPDHAATADLDLDGDLDLLLSIFSGTLGLVVLPGDGSGSFGAPIGTPTGAAPRDLAVGRFDADAIPDVVLLDATAGAVELWTGAGNLTFAQRASVTVAGSPNFVRAADVDADGDVDAAVLMSQGDVVLLLGDGAGGFAAPVTVDGAPGLQGEGLVVDDLDGNGLPDLAVFLPADVWVHLGAGGGSFLPRKGYAMEAVVGFDTATSGDLTGDGLPELIASAGALTQVLPNLGGTFGAARVFGAPEFVYAPSKRPPASGDLDGDGALDLAWAGGLPVKGGISPLLSRSGPAQDLGLALAGTHGRPVLTVFGSFQPDASIKILVENALESSVAHIVLGASRLDAPFKGGVLVPALDLLILSQPLDAAGSLELASTWPPGLPSGLQAWTQFWITDAGGPAGYAATNAFELTLP